ncbi:MAG: ribonuclease PH [Verrucomicrobiae bacterium]|nr:ribonuclease PH [Verrucomicrobiae bacterium]
MLRSDGRRADELRPIRFQNGIAPYALGSTLVEWGCTRIICAVTVEEAVPKWIKDQGLSGGWITAEYSMLPYSTIERKPREITKGRADGRVQEIQRLIGRAVRAVVNLEKIGSRTLWIDCDVIQADGGTRTASITGAYVALVLAVRKMLSNGLITENPILDSVAAVSLGIVGGRMLLDLNYTEDSTADVDLNLVMTGSGRIIEVQGTGERTTFDETQLLEMLKLGRSAIQTLTSLQSSTLAHTTFG